MRVARLHNRIVVERPVVSRGTAGEEIMTWSRFGMLWAAIEPVVSLLAARDVVTPVQVLAEGRVLVTLRWSPHAAKIDSTYRFRSALRGDATIYSISGPPIHINMGNREIRFNCATGLTSS